MTFLVRYRDITLFRKEEYGVKDVSFDIQPRQKYHLILENEEKARSLTGLLEGRYKADSGVIHKPRSVFTQSDRLLLEDKIYEQTAARWLNLADEMFQFGGRKRSKRVFLERIKARSIRHFPVYKLKGDDKIKFTLLSITFQESGLILISRLPYMRLTADMIRYLLDVFQNSQCAICVITGQEDNLWMTSNKADLNATLTTIDLTDA